MKLGKVAIGLGVVALCGLGVVLLVRNSNKDITLTPVYFDSKNEIKKRPPITIPPRYSSQDSKNNIGRKEGADQPSFGKRVDYDKQVPEESAPEVDIMVPDTSEDPKSPPFRKLTKEEVTQLKLKDYQQYLRYEKQRLQLERGETPQPREITEAERKRIIKEELKPKLLEALAKKKVEAQAAGTEASVVIEGSN